MMCSRSVPAAPAPSSVWRPTLGKGPDPDALGCGDSARGVGAFASACGPGCRACGPGARRFGPVGDGGRRGPVSRAFGAVEDDGDGGWSGPVPWGGVRFAPVPFGTRDGGAGGGAGGGPTLVTPVRGRVRVPREPDEPLPSLGASPVVTAWRTP